MNEQAEELKARAAAFAKAIIDLCEKAPRTKAARTITGQLIDAATSVASNYRAACRSRSKAEFVAKIGLVVEEADECCGWLEMLVDTNILTASHCEAASQEAYELTAIFNASHKTAKRNLGSAKRVVDGPQSKSKSKI